MGEQIQSNEEYKNGHEGLKRGHILQLNCEEATPALNHPSECLLQRIDHLDEILSIMEDKSPTEHEHSTSQSGSPRTTSRRHSSAPTTPSGLEKRCRPTEFVLEEVQEKGTLVERISDLEKRVMTLQRMLPLKSKSENPSSFPHRRVVSHQETYDQQFLQEPMDVEKHEVMTLSQSDPSKCKGHSEPSVDSISHDPAKPDSSHVKHHEDMVSSGKASDTEEHDSGVPRQVSKKKRLKIRKWLSKRLHIHLPGTPQDKHRCSPGHCWGPQIHPNSCWNVRKRDSHSTPYTQYGHMSIDDE